MTSESTSGHQSSKDSYATLNNQPSFNPSLPEDLAVRLRNVGSRVRKSVTEGYLSASPGAVSPFSRSVSTPHIFRSAKDTLRDVFAQPIHEEPSAPTKKKRARSVEAERVAADGAESEAEASGDALPNEEGPIKAASPVLRPPMEGRDMKPLRKPRRGMMVTQSMPAGLLSFGGARTVEKPPTVVVESFEEDDWSADTTTSLSTFQPTVL